MDVRIAEKCGFCFGVEGAIASANEAVETYGKGNVASLGPVIHNQQVVDRLEASGLKAVESLDEIHPGDNILIRSHGVRPEVLQEAEKKGANVVNATCVLVQKAQKTVRRLHEEGYTVVMIGDENHPEVNGVIGYAPDVIVIDRLEEVEGSIPRNARLGIVAQTTHTLEHVALIIAEIARHPYAELKIINTLCKEGIRRQEAAISLAREVDVMFVLGGRHSANTRELARMCMEQGVDTHHLEVWGDFDPSMVEGKSIAGITAGASTPDWIINEFAENLAKLK